MAVTTPAPELDGPDFETIVRRALKDVLGSMGDRRLRIVHDSIGLVLERGDLNRFLDSFASLAAGVNTLGRAVARAVERMAPPAPPSS